MPPPTSITVQTPSIKVAGAPLAVAVMDDLLDLRVALSVRAAGRAQLHVEDASFAVLDADTFPVGAALEVSLPTANDSIVRAFVGEIVSVGVEQGHGGRHELVVVALDRAHRLGSKGTGTTYLNQTLGDVVAKIARRHGLTPRADATGGAEPYLLQTGSDYAFLWELAESVGFEWFVDDKTLHFRKRPDTRSETLTWGDDLLRFQARYSAADAAVKSLTVRGWDSAQQAVVKGDASAVLSKAGARELGSDAPLAAAAHAKATSAFGNTIDVGAYAVRTAAEAEALAGSLARTLLGDAVTARGEAVGNPRVKPGTLVTIAKMGTKLSGRYYITECEHVFGVGRPLVTRFGVSGHAPAGPLHAALAPGSPSAWGTNGIVVGVVTNVADDGKQGRVKVRYPTLGDKVESTWARLALPGAGKDRGFDVRPEVGDEVVVAFDRGDPRQAVVLGGLWSAKQGPAASNAISGAGKVERRALVSRLGHRVELVDGDGDAQRYVEIALADGKTKVHVAQDRIDIVAAPNKPLTVKSGNTSIAITANGDLTVKGVNVTLEASAKLTLKAPQIEAKGQATVKLESAGQLEAKGAMVTVQGSGVTQVKGSVLKLN